MDRAKKLTRQYFTVHDNAYADVFNFLFWRQKKDLVVDTMDLCPIGESQIRGIRHNETLFETPAEREFIRLWRRADGKEALLVLKLEADDEILPQIVLFGGNVPEGSNEIEDFRNPLFGGVLSSISGDGKLIPMITATVQLDDRYPLDWVKHDLCTVDPRTIEDADFQHFQTELSQVFHVLKYRNSDKYPGPGKFVNVSDDALFLLLAFDYPTFPNAAWRPDRGVNLVAAFQAAQDHACAECISAAQRHLHLTYREALQAFEVPKEQWSRFRNWMRQEEMKEEDEDEEETEPCGAMKGLLQDAISERIPSAMKNLNLTLEAVLAACDIPENEWDTYRELLEKAETGEDGDGEETAENAAEDTEAVPEDQA